MNDAEKEICRGDRANLALFFYAELASGPLRLTAGVNDVPVAADAVDIEGGIYTAMGGFGPGAPDIDMALNGQAQGLTFELNGATEETVQLYVRDRAEVIGARAAFGWQILDERYRPAGVIRWPIVGHLFKPSVRRNRKASGASHERVISVTLIAGSYVRRRGVHAYLSGAEQRRLHPTDASCDRVSLYSRDVTRHWPN